jgi:outer membrane protein OmpA-like peptidoglycan-associated protein
MKNSPIVKLVLLLFINFCLFRAQAQPAKPAVKTPVAKTPVAAKQPAKPTETSKKYSVYFDVNQSRIKPNDYKVLDSVVTILTTQTNIRRIQITGYADTTGGAEANMILSDNRTDTVAGYILSKNLKHYKSKIATSSLGEKVTGKEADLNEMRRVDIVLYMARPDRDTVIKLGCVTAMIKANTFEGFNNDEVVFKIEYINTAADAKKYNMTFKDDKGNNLLSNGAVRISATYKGKPVKAALPIVVNMPKSNNETGYNLYKGVEEKVRNITYINSWKQVEGNIMNIGISTGANGENCNLQSFTMKDLNVFYNASKTWPSCYCTADDPFGGLLNPDNSNELARVGPEKSVVVLNDAAFKKVDATKAYVQVLDNLFPNEFLNFCNGFLLPGVGDVPEIPKFDREILKFIDFNVSQKNDTADAIMVKKTKVLLMIPKSKYPFHDGKQYAVVYADTKKDNFLSWSNKIVLNNACLGLANCGYWIFEVPFTGFYSLVELTPNDARTKNGLKDDGSSDDEKKPKYVKIKTKKFKDVHVIYGARDENSTQMANFIKNKGKNSINEPAIAKKNKKQYKQHIFLAYVIVSGKRYAWIGKGSQLKKGLFSGNWKTPKLVYVPDEDWEAFVRKACE